MYEIANYIIKEIITLRMGVEVAEPTHGIFIQNGVKYVFK